MKPIILASSSPRRQEILKLLNIPFQVKVSNFEEDYPSDIQLEQVPEFLANRKVDAVARTYPQGHEIPWILGADTMILLDGKLYGKPQDNIEATKFMKDFQGKTHQVITGIALFNGDLMYASSRTVITNVTFAPMTDEEIEWYVETGDWHGAAGGYRIQGLASCFIKKIEGTNSNVVGLPIFDLYDMLKEQNYSILE
ncbi:MAG: septum formation protein Maf [Treponema sp.]|nr:septum formation protein Maf [Treponema sp.]